MNLPPKALYVLADLKRELLSVPEPEPKQCAPIDHAEKRREQRREQRRVTARATRARTDAYQRACQRRDWWAPVY